MKIKKGDSVQVVKGKDKGKTEQVVSVFTKEGKVLVENVNQYKRHVKARTQNQKSEIKTITVPLSIANVALVCPKCKKTTRVAYKIDNKEKVRVCAKCKAAI